MWQSARALHTYPGPDPLDPYALTSHEAWVYRTGRWILPPTTSLTPSVPKAHTKDGNGLPSSVRRKRWSAGTDSPLSLPSPTKPN